MAMSLIHRSNSLSAVELGYLLCCPLGLTVDLEKLKNNTGLQTILSFLYRAIQTIARQFPRKIIPNPPAGKKSIELLLMPVPYHPPFINKSVNYAT